MGIDLILGWLTEEESVVWMYHYLVISMPMSGIVKRQFQSLEGLLAPCRKCRAVSDHCNYRR